MFFGHLLETFVVGELRKQIGWSDGRVNLYHYRTTTGRGVDIVLEDAAGQLVGLEVKASSTVTQKDFSGFDALSEDSDGRFVRGIVLYSREQPCWLALRWGGEGGRPGALAVEAYNGAPPQPRASS